MKIAFLDCFCGVSGDMLLGALLDGGLSLEELQEGLSGLPLKGYRIEARREARHGIFGTRCLVTVDDPPHTHRGLREIRDLIEGSGLPRTVREKGIEVFESLARVEGAIHGKPVEEVHFHEVGAVDSIVDILGTLYGLDRLKVEQIFASPLPVGSGFVKTSHGTLPVPAPATLALLRGVPLLDGGVRHELVTPTGAALIRSLVRSFGPMPPMIVEALGYGVGGRDLLDRPNLLRILLGRDAGHDATDTVMVLETSVDDANPEWLGFLMERLFAAGALDVAFLPIQMKKGRPGVQIQVMARPDQGDLLMGIILAETPTLGIRFRYSQRRIRPRSFREVESPWGKIRVKVVAREEGPPILAPEYEACREAAVRHRIPLRDVYGWIAGLRPETLEPP